MAVAANVAATVINAAMEMAVMATNLVAAADKEAATMNTTAATMVAAVENAVATIFGGGDLRQSWRTRRRR